MDSDGAGAFDDGTRLMAKRPSRTSTGMSMQWTAEESIPASVNAIPAPTLRRLSRSIAYNLQDSTATQMPPVMGGVGGCDASVNMSHPTVSDGANVTRGTNGSTLLLRNIIGQRRGSFHTQPKSKEVKEE